jgi:hypothetical protein
LSCSTRDESVPRRHAEVRLEDVSAPPDGRAGAAQPAQRLVAVTEAEEERQLG